jgi:DNA invertase Pin-like site-specific DNA recombinase
VYVYVRVSTIRQDQSPETQRTVAGDLALRNQLERIDGFYQDAPVKNRDGTQNDAISGKVSLEDRRAGAELCKVLAKGDVVIVSKMDRLFRKLSDCVQILDRWERLGVRLLSGDFAMFSNLADPYSKALLQMIAVFSELERKLIAQRTKESIALKKRKRCGVNLYPGYGFQFDIRVDQRTGKKVRHIIPNPEERAIMAQIVKWRLDGSTFDEIAEHLGNLGQVTKHDKPWSMIRCFRVFHAELELQATENRRNG